MGISDQLENQIRDARLTISSEGYPMSIGELTNLYRDGELKIRPEFQRFFRWSPLQKTLLVESIILGIPLPSIFVAQSEGGVWELVDGLQRVSTILELQGELLDQKGDPKPQLVLEGTKYLPSLAGKSWLANDPYRSFSEALRLDIKRSKIDIKIIKRESSRQAKFDLFRRLNNYGSPLNTQEMRSALLVSVSTDFFSWLENLASDQNFIECTQLSEKLIEERFDLELVTRFLVLHDRPESRLTLSSLRDLSQVLDDVMVEMAMSFPEKSELYERVFRESFSFIFSNGGESVFRRWDINKNQFQGSFLNTAFEVFGLGVGFHIAQGRRPRPDLIDVVKRFWSRPDMQRGYATGKSTEARLVQFIPDGRNITSSESIFDLF